MPISKNSSLYHGTWTTMAALLGVAAGSAGLFIWLNQQGLDHSWQQAYHEPAPWSAFTSSAWSAGGQVEAVFRARVVAVEEALAPYQDIMSTSAGTADEDSDDGNDEGLDIGDQRAPVTHKVTPTVPTIPIQKPSLSHDVATTEKYHASSDKTITYPKKQQNQPAQQQTPLPPPSPLPFPVPQNPLENVQVHATSSHKAEVAQHPTQELKESGQNHILFIGDSMMQGVAPHVVTALRRHYHVQSYDISLQSTGLSYPNFFNWPDTLRTTLEQKPGITTVVVFLGPNDPWDMPSTVRHGHYLKFRSPAWEEDYRGRIQTILQTAQEHHARVIWLGPPATKRVRLSEGIGYLDQLFQSETEKAGQTYLSVDQLFHYHGHEYRETMERDGHEIRLRSGDGTHFSVTGQKIIAAAVMKELRPDLEKEGLP